MSGERMHKYLSKREELRLAEIELMRQRERVAELRRGFRKARRFRIKEGPANLDAGDTPIRTVRPSELFSAPNRSLVVYQFMFGKKNATPCPVCTLWIDGWNGVAHHLAQNVDVAIVAAADLGIDFNTFGNRHGIPHDCLTVSIPPAYGVQTRLAFRCSEYTF